MIDKDKEMVILKSNILRPGEKFIITDKSTDGKFIPGSTGFVSFVKGVDQQFSNVVHFTVVLTKKGKTGKERIEMSDMSAPIFEPSIPGEEFILPGPDRRYFIRMEHIKNNVDDIHKMPTYDFMGWALARIKFLQKLSSKVTHVKVWPQSQVINTVLELPHMFSESPNKTKEYFSTKDIIEEIATTLSKTEAKLSRCLLGYLCQTSILELKAARGIFDFYIGKTPTKMPKLTNEEMSLLDSTVVYYATKADILNRLHASSGQLTEQIKDETTAVLNSMLYFAV